MAPSKHNPSLLNFWSYDIKPAIRYGIWVLLLLELLPVLVKAQIKIMPMGNSITQGHPTYSTYRRELWFLLQNNGYNAIDFVGSMRTSWDRVNSKQVPAPYQDFDLDHEGHSGWRADEIKGSSYGWVNDYKPDILLLHVGTNDILQNQSLPTTIDDISDIINGARSAKPTIIILLAQIIGSNRDERVEAQIAALNKEIPKLAERKHTSQSPVYVVDQASGFNPVDDTYDGVHPNTKGEKKMADVWFAALQKVLPPPAPLPIKLVSFSANYEHTSKWIRVEWVTAGEKNNSFFTVERSKDQAQFEFVKNLPGAFTTQIEQIYTTYDQSPLSGTSYYRLKQTDKDGTSTYSKVVSVKNFRSNFAVYPNPVHGRELTVLLTPGSAETDIAIYNTFGKLVYHDRQATEINAERKIVLDKDLHEGIYFLKVHTKKEDFIQKLVILAN
jgi:hypothetical protein